MLKVKEVAERIGVSVACVYGLIASVKLACHRIGVGRGTIRVSEEQLRAYLERTATQIGEKAAEPPLR